MWGEFGDMEERREVFSIKYLEKRFSLYIGVNTRIIVRISGEWKCMLELFYLMISLIFQRGVKSRVGACSEIGSMAIPD